MKKLLLNPPSTNIYFYVRIGYRFVRQMQTTRNLKGYGLFFICFCRSVNEKRSGSRVRDDEQLRELEKK